MFNKQYIFNQKKIFFIILSINIIQIQHHYTFIDMMIQEENKKQGEKFYRDLCQQLCNKIIDDNKEVLGYQEIKDYTINFHHYQTTSNKISLANSIFVNNSSDKSLQSKPLENHPIIFAADALLMDYIYLLNTPNLVKKRTYLKLNFTNKNNTYIYGFLAPLSLGIIINMLSIGILKLLFFLLNNKKNWIIYLTMLIINFIYLAMEKFIIKKFFSNKSFLLKNYFKNIDTDFMITLFKMLGFFSLWFFIVLFLGFYKVLNIENEVNSLKAQIWIFSSMIFSLAMVLFFKILHLLSCNNVGLYENRSIKINNKLIDYSVIYLSNHHLKFLSKRLDKNDKLFKFDDSDINLTNILNVFYSFQ